MLHVTPLGNTDATGLSPRVLHKDTKSKTTVELSVFVVLEWLTRASHGDCGLEQVTRDHWRHVFHKMQLTTNSVDEESKAGMMIAVACKPAMSGRETEVSGQG